MQNKSRPKPILRESLVEMNRLNNLSDGVFAIALTLLAFDLRLPEIVSNEDLPNKLIDLAPKFAVYLISFIVIGGAWGAHQRMLQQIKRGDGLLAWFNLFCLLFVALVPPCAAILGRYPNEFVAIIIFALDVAFIQLTTFWLWQHASQGGLINPKLDPRVVVSIGRRLKFSTFIFVLSIPLALWSPWITYLFWIAFFLLLFTTDWLSWQLASRTQQTAVPLDDLKRAHVHVQHGGGLLQIDAQADRNILFNGVFGGGLASHVDRSGESADVELRIPERWGLLNYKYPWTWGPENAPDWTLHLSDQIPLMLDVEISGGVMNLELGALKITNLKIKVNSSETHISLPDGEGHAIITIESKAAAITIQVPADAAANIHTAGDVWSNDIDLGRFPMIDRKGEYRSKRYKTASKRLDIHIENSTSYVSIT